METKILKCNNDYDGMTKDKFYIVDKNETNYHWVDDNGIEQSSNNLDMFFLPRRGRPKKGDEDERIRQHKEYQKLYRWLHREERTQDVIEWFKNNPDRVREYRKEYYRKYRERNRTKVQEYNRKSYLKKKARKNDR